MSRPFRFRVQAFSADTAAEWKDLARHPHALIGSVSEICETLQQRRDTYGISYVTVRGANMAEFAPVVAALSGT
ncbi:hypothetical protein [Candidatus Poriferisodalis multihospitum]|uniref:hypothetical protein n=1 Tax=Candidatus Poriferisodalis multihospitum TaxID=2983191 RepID=UPI002B25EF62|nr:hypothetical protein [Candidatus Poriferisodalis multihospitum]